MMLKLKELQRQRNRPSKGLGGRKRVMRKPELSHQETKGKDREGDGEYLERKIRERKVSVARTVGFWTRFTKKMKGQKGRKLAK